MPKAEWLSVSPASGANNQTVNLSSSAPHTGRSVRSTVLTFKATNCTDVPVTVNQAGKAEFVDIAESSAPSKAGGNVTISGTSNSNKLTFSLGTGDININLPASYLANSLTTNNGTAIDGDPGALVQYPFSIVLTIPENTTTSSLTRQLIVTDNGGHQDTCLITQSAGDPTLSVTPTVVELTSAGTAVTVAVTSNTNWTTK